jgi:hypothetical protein
MTRQALAHILTINVPLFKKLRDIVEGPWLQKDNKITNVPLFKKIWDIIFFLGQ